MILWVVFCQNYVTFVQELELTDIIVVAFILVKLYCKDRFDIFSFRKFYSLDMIMTTI